jgi:preprotein translocase subunit SecG
MKLGKNHNTMDLGTILQFTTLGSGVLMIICILLQQRGASLGAGFGSSGELYTTRRGLDKSLFDATIVLAVVFALSILAGLLLPGLNG